MRIRALGLLLLGLVLTVLFTRAGDDGAHPNLTGVVRDQSAQPLRGATVFIYTAGPKEGTGVLCPSCYADCRKRARTDAEGKFTIEELDPSLLFRVLVVAKGHQPEFVAKVDPTEKPIEVTLRPVSGGDTPDKRMRGIVLDQDDKPVAGAVVNIRGVSRGNSTRFGGNKEVDPVAVTDDAGEFAINSTEPFDAVGVDVEAFGLAKGIFQKLATGGEVHTLKLNEGVTVKGKVLHDGKPLAGVEMGIAGANRRSEIFVGDFSVGTDTNGAFLFPNLPARTDYFVYGRMKSFGEKGSISSRRVKTQDIGSTLDVGDLAVQPAFRLEGVVRLTDSNSIPEKTQVMVTREDAWDQLMTQADAQGRFKLAGIPSEAISVYARVSGYRYSLRNASLDVQNPSSLVGRLHTNKTDLVIELERGERHERLDGNSQAQREEPLRGAEAPRPDGDIKVRGTVVDAETGKALPAFTITEGRQDQYNMGRFEWYATRKTKHEEGKFTISLTKQRFLPALMVEADGYLPQASATITNADAELTFALKKGSGTAGVLLNPDGKPAGGVKVYLSDMRNGVHLDGEQLKIRESVVRSTRSTTTDDAGRFAFEPMIDAFSLIVVDDAGYLEKRVQDIPANAELRLQRWARVRGQLLIGANPGTNESIRLWPAHIPYEHHPRDFAAVQFYINTKSDAEGKFVFERVPPTHVEIYHEPKVRDGRMGTVPMAQTTKFTLRPDETREVKLGGKGRPVVGKIVVDGYEGKINWRADVHMLEAVVPDPEGVPNLRAMSQEFSTNVRAAETDEEKAALQAEFNVARKAAIEKHKEFYATAAGRAHHFRNKRYALNFSQDGTFRIDDVPGGSYKLKLDLREGDGDDMRFSKPQIASLEKEIEVPDSPGGRTDEPYDLGEIAVQARASMKAGKAAPEFEVKTVDGKSIKLSDFKGKYVLLDFWAVWCGPCIAETPNLKEAYAAFKDDPRFVMIGLSLDPKESAPRDYAKKNDLGWVQGFLGEWSKTDLPKQYGVEGIPAIFLIGPDGKIVSTGLRGPGIKSAIQAAIKNDK